MSELLCTFRIQGKLFGVGVAQVQEVLRAQRLTPIPQASAAFAGLMNLRGQIVLVIEPRYLLCHEVKEQKESPMFVVLRSADGPLAIRVDEVGEVVNANPEDAEGSVQDGFISSAYKLPEEI